MTTPDGTPADIPDDEFLNAVRAARRLRGFATRWDVGAILDGDFDFVRAEAAADSDPSGVAYPKMPPPIVPEGVVLAKAQGLIDRGVLTGCCCGCRGGFGIVGDIDD